MILFAIDIEVRSQVLGYLNGQKGLCRRARGCAAAQAIYRSGGNRWCGESAGLAADQVGRGWQPGRVERGGGILRAGCGRNRLALHRQIHAYGETVRAGGIRVIERIRPSGLEFGISKLEGMRAGYIRSGEVLVNVGEGFGD